MSVPQVLVYDQNVGALAWRVQLAREVLDDGDDLAASEVIGVRSPTAFCVLAQLAPAGSLALIDLCDSDRDPLARKGEWLIESVARRGMPCHAWTAHGTPDALRSALAAGARSVIAASIGSGAAAEREREQLRAAFAEPTTAVVEPAALLAEPAAPHAAPNASTPATQAWYAWFLERYGKRWQPWMEHALALLASTGERGAQGRELHAAGVVSSPKAGQDRQRDLAALIAGDAAHVPATVARQASLILARIAATRSLATRPGLRPSISHAAQALADQPSLARAAGLFHHEVTGLLALGDSLRSRRNTGTRSVGRPLAGEGEGELLRAAVDVVVAAGSEGLTGVDKQELAAGAVACAVRTAAAVGDALDDELFAPEARAAAALLSLSAVPSSRWPEQVAGPEGAPSWNGLSAAELARATETDPAQLRALTAAIDAVLRD